MRHLTALFPLTLSAVLASGGEVQKKSASGSQTAPQPRATRADRAVTVMVWNYHDDDLPGPAAAIDFSVAGVSGKRVLINHYRVDGEHSNSYELWKKMGSPQSPTPEQYKELESAGQLQLLGSPEWKDVTNGQAKLQFSLPRQGVSMVKLTW
jgi:xylan 1,4-beta-xylosidase